MKRHHFSIGYQTHTENYIYYELWPKAYCFKCRIIILTSKSTAVPIIRISNIGEYSFDWVISSKTSEFTSLFHKI